MSDDREVLPAVPPAGAPPAPAMPEGPPPPAVDPLDDEGSGFSLRRYVHALVRFRWLVALAGVLGVGAGWLVLRSAEAVYVTQGNIWIDAQEETAGGPFRQGGLFESSAWLGLLRSYSVLDPVVVQERLYLRVGPANRDLFEGFTVRVDDFRPGGYVLRTGPDRRWTLLGTDEFVHDEGAPGEAVGEAIGFQWTPPAGRLAPDQRIEFAVVAPRDAARQLQQDLQAGMDRQGNFISLALPGRDPRRITSVLNAVMERHVAVAAELKRAKLEEQRTILEDQLRYAQQELERAEQALEEFRIRTITLPSDRGTPIAAGLEATRDPVYMSYFQRKLALEQLRSDRRRLGAVLDAIPSTGLSLEALEGVASAVGSSQLRMALQEVIEARAQLRALRTRYEDEYPGVQDLLARIERIETVTIPTLGRELDAELASREQTLASGLEAASGELTNIPPRTIEEARLRRQVAIQEALYNELRTRVEAARLTAASSIPDVRILDAARVPEIPLNDERMRLVLMVFGAFLGAGLIGAILLDRMDPILRDPVQVESEMKLEVLGAIPRIEAGDAERTEQVVEAFRSLRLSVDYAYGRAGPLMITVSSPAGGEGKTLVATNLAIAFASVGRRTLLIDADTRLGDAHELLGLERKPGLTDFLNRNAGSEIVQRTAYPHLHFIASGSRRVTSPELLASGRMASLIGSVKRSYQVVVVDSPPLSAGGDAMAVAAMTGALAVVIRSGTTNREMTAARLEALERLPVRVLGAVLNEFSDRGAQRYYSSYLPGYGSRDEEEAPRPLTGSPAPPLAALPGR